MSKKTNNELLNLLIYKINNISQDINELKSDIRIIKTNIIVDRQMNHLKKKEPEPEPMEVEGGWLGWRFL
jgi:hypothetical protein